MISHFRLFKSISFITLIEFHCTSPFIIKFINSLWNNSFKTFILDLNKVMCHWINRTSRVSPYWYSSFPYVSRNVLSCIITRIRGYVHKMLSINSAIELHLHVKMAKLKNIYSKKIYNVNKQPNFQELLCYHSLSSARSFNSSKQVHNIWS